MPGADYILRFLAERYSQPEAQMLAETLLQKGHASRSMPWLGLLWQGGGGAGAPAYAPFSGKPLAKHFEDMGLISVRSGWDAGADVLGFHCGPPLGLSYHGEADCGAGHVHPDANHITLFANGTCLLSDDWYPEIKKTFAHSTLTVGGAGQFGDKDRWYQASRQLMLKKRPQITLFSQHGDCIMFEGDGAAAYPPELGLLHFARRVCYYPKKRELEIRDMIEQSGNEELVLRFWTDGADSVEISGNSATVAKDGARMRFCAEGGGVFCHETAMADTRNIWTMDSAHGAYRLYCRDALCLKSSAAIWNSTVKIAWE
jgi:hypothetical protein